MKRTLRWPEGTTAFPSQCSLVGRATTSTNNRDFSNHGDCFDVSTIAIVFANLNPALSEIAHNPSAVQDGGDDINVRGMRLLNYSSCAGRALRK
jgi:hypothetical protein